MNRRLPRRRSTMGGNGYRNGNGNGNGDDDDNNVCGVHGR